MHRQLDGLAAPATVGEALRYCSAALSEAELYFGHGTDNPWDEAVQLVLSVVDLPMDAGDSVLPHPLEEAAGRRLHHLLRQRIEDRVPLPYLLGRAWYAGLELRCDPRALVPRSPIAELVLNEFRPWYTGPSPQRVLDLCCGGGSIGLAAAHYLPGVTVDLLDLDADALALAAENAQLLGLTGRVRMLRSDLFAAVPGESYDIILCNPPYVDAADMGSLPAEYRHEPALGLKGGPDGMAVVDRILAGAAERLNTGGLLVLEVGEQSFEFESRYPDLDMAWVELVHGGEGVMVIEREALAARLA